MALSALLLPGLARAQDVTFEATVGFDRLDAQDTDLAWEAGAGVRLAGPPFQILVGLGRMRSDGSAGCLEVGCAGTMAAEVGLRTGFLETRYWLGPVLGPQTDLFVGLRGGIVDLEDSDAEGWSAGARAGVHLTLPGGLILTGSVLRDHVELDVAGHDVLADIGDGVGRWGVRVGVGARF